MDGNGWVVRAETEGMTVGGKNGGRDGRKLELKDEGWKGWTDEVIESLGKRWKDRGKEERIKESWQGWDNNEKGVIGSEVLTLGVT